MKTIIAIISGILIFCLGFWLDAQLINWIVSNFQDPRSDLAIVVKMVLWVVTFGVTFSLSAMLGLIVATYISSLLEN